MTQSRPFSRIKVLTLGASCTGKSCLIKRYCERKFVARYISTIGLDYGVKVHTVNQSTSQSNNQSNNQSVSQLRVNLFDLSGSPVYKSIRLDFYADTQAILACFDVNNRSSFDCLIDWLIEAKSGMSPASVKKLVVCICGTMSNEQSINQSTNQSVNQSINQSNSDADEGLSSRRPRAVTFEEGQSFAQRIDGLYFECSSKTGENVNQLFDAVFDKVMRNVQISGD